jgi:aspartokinase/homoserine dehydrogenase 1
VSRVVLKFGGSSVGTAAAMRATVGVIAAAARAGERPTVVVSALAGVTDELVAAVGRSRSGDAGREDVVERLRGRHVAQLAALAGPASPAARRAAEAFESVLDGLRRRLDVVSREGARDAPVAAMLAAGERLAAPLLAAALDAAGVDAEVVEAIDLLVVDGDPEDGVPDVAASRPRALARFAFLGERVAVVPGFHGAGRDGEPKLFGRGGSDTAATALGAALGAGRVEIWTDVDGVAAVDPRAVPGARPIARMSWDRAEALAATGARVLHAKSLAPAREAGVPVVVRNTFRPGAPGTWIDAPEPAPAAPARARSLAGGWA